MSLLLTKNNKLRLQFTRAYENWTIKDVCLGKRCECVWLSLLLFLGSISNKVFHEVLLDTCLDLTRHCWPQDSEKKRKKDLKSSQTEGKRSRPQRKDSPEVLPRIIVM